jgi:hypothetical protein
MSQNKTLVLVGQIFELAELIRMLVKTTTPHTNILFCQDKLTKTESFEGKQGRSQEGKKSCLCLICITITTFKCDFGLILMRQNETLV